MTATILASSLGDVRSFFEELPDIATQAARLAINDVAANEGLATLRKEMREQVNFPPGYLENDRLKLRRKASNASLEAVISGRDRATSLARFAKGQTPGNTRGRGVRVEVKRGRTQLLRKAFLVPLNNGNIGLAVRLKPGETLSNSDKAVKLENNVYLLYGPSVDQVFKDVAAVNAPRIADLVSREFYRQFARLSRG